jgi:mitochondrial fission protein ELM1
MTKCWILTEQGLKGTENQCIALAQAAGFDYELKTVKLKNPWKFLTPFIRAFSPKALAPGSSELAAPWPDILIASGRKAIAPALWVKQQSGGKTKLVIIQSPVIKDKNFDLVIVPQHDEYDGENVLKITGALSLVTSETLAAAKAEFGPQLEQLSTPRIAVLIGGNSRTHKITPQIARLLVMQLKKLLQQNFSLMVTASRRTPSEIQDQLRKELIGPQIAFYAGDGPNPYQAYLAWADAILVTEDSVSMACEAISTGKPVYIIRLSGGSKRFKRFHDHLAAQSYARWFTGQVNDFAYVPPNDLKAAVAKIGDLFNKT